MADYIPPNKVQIARMGNVPHTVDGTESYEDIARKEFAGKDVTEEDLHREAQKLALINGPVDGSHKPLTIDQIHKPLKSGERVYLSANAVRLRMMKETVSPEVFQDTLRATLSAAHLDLLRLTNKACHDLTLLKDPQFVKTINDKIITVKTQREVIKMYEGAKTFVASQVVKTINDQIITVMAQKAVIQMYEGAKTFVEPQPPWVLFK